MKISYIEIRNFRGINHAELCDLKSTVVIAGPNGCGKSAILDAIRLIKSAYGGYQPNEWQQWMGEFQINMAIASDMNRILHNRERDAQIKCDFMLDPNERAFLRTHARDLLEDMVWPQILPNIPSGPAGRIVRSMEPWNQRKAEVDEAVEKLYPELNLELNARSIKAMLGFGPNKTMQTARSVVLALMFSIYKPGVLGVIDYHGPQRHFSRESVQGVNLDLSAVEQQRVQSALYNYGNKYTNIKTEMAASYLHDMLAEKAGRGEPVDPSLATTMQELFKTFFRIKNSLVRGRL